MSSSDEVKQARIAWVSGVVALFIATAGIAGSATVQAHHNQVQRTQQIEACADAGYDAAACMAILRGTK